MKYLKPALFSFLTLQLCLSALGQAPCKPPEIVSNKNTHNIFSEEQEVYLGDVIAETVDKNFLVLQDSQATLFLEQMGARLLRHLPPTNIKFRFFVVDSPELNAFNVAGGRIYVTRKLISFVRSEDELAGILGHELGHGIVRHHSADYSKAFQEILGVSRVGDRQDVFEKFNELLDRQRTKRLKRRGGHEGDQQLEADRIGLYAMMAAGYDPNAYATAWERMTEIKPKSGGGLGDLFGGSKPEQKRLREVLKTIGSLPAECRYRSVEGDAASFERWRSYVVSILSVRYQEKFQGLISKGRLTPALRGDVRHFQFSPDGNYILAIDASGVNILKREPFGFLFRINIDNVKAAHFSPDSKTFVVQTYGLRIELWDIESHKPILVREVYVREPCMQTALSPDAQTLVCFTAEGDLHLINVATNEKIFTKRKFYELNFFDAISVMSDAFTGKRRESELLEMEFSPNGQYFLAGRVFRVAFENMVMGASFAQLFGSNFDQQAFVAYDLSERREIKLPESLKDVVAMPFAFYSNDKIIGQHRDDSEKSGIFTFPGGERVEKFRLSGNSYERPFNGDYIFVRPIKDSAVGVFNIPQRKILLTNKTYAMDGWGDFFIAEGGDGGIVLVKFENAKVVEVGKVALPANDLADIRTIAVSDGFDRLALSEGTRGGVWDLGSGNLKAHVRGFRGSHIDEKGMVYADFPALDGEPRRMALLDPGNSSKFLDPLSSRSLKQNGKFLIRFKTRLEESFEKQQKSKDGKSEKSDGEEGKITFSRGLAGVLSRQGATLEISDAVTRSTLWSRKYESEPPTVFTDSRAETVTLYWPVTEKTAKEIIKKSPQLAAKAKSMGEKEGDYLVQVLNANTGAELGTVLIETGEGSFTIERVFTVGDWLTIIDSENRILFYSLATGELKSRVFGEDAAVNPARSIAAVENIPGVLALVDLNTGRRIDEFRFPSRISYAAFDKQGGKLFVLTANQRYYIFNASAIGSQAR